MTMDIRKIRALIELIEKKEIDEIEITEGEESVRIRRSPPQNAVYSSPPPVSYTVNAASEAPRPAGASESPKEPEALKGHVIKSPMVGTLYTSPQPDAPSYVAVGQKVDAGDILCIVEAMKMFNHIEADKAGTITARLVENGQPVEYGQPLFIIE